MRWKNIMNIKVYKLCKIYRWSHFRPWTEFSNAHHWIINGSLRYFSNIAFYIKKVKVHLINSHCCSVALFTFLQSFIEWVPIGHWILVQSIEIKISTVSEHFMCILLKWPCQDYFLWATHQLTKLNECVRKIFFLHPNIGCTKEIQERCNHRYLCTDSF